MPLEVAASPAAEEMPESMPMSEGVRKLLGTLTVSTERGLRGPLHETQRRKRLPTFPRIPHPLPPPYPQPR